MEKLLREYPLIVTTGAFAYGSIKRDHVWLTGFVGSLLSMLANRGLKWLSRRVTESDPEWKEILNRPHTDTPGMPSGNSQIAAAFFVFLAVWFWYFKHDSPIAYPNILLTLAAILGFMTMQNIYLKEEQTRLQIIVGSIVGAIFGLVPYYALRYWPRTSQYWNVPETTMEIWYLIFLPTIVFLVGTYIGDFLITYSDNESSSSDI